jgi:hypothetical protein
MSYLWELIGYGETIEADEHQKHLKHVLMRQIEKSKLKLKQFENTIKRKNRQHNKKRKVRFNPSN